MPDTAVPETAAGPPEDTEAEQMLAEATNTDPWADPESARKEIEKLRRESAGWRTKYRDAEPLAQRALEIEEAQKTEVQKLAERASAAEKAASDKDVELLRLRTALKFGISDEDAEVFLTGATQEALTRQAERLAALRPTAAPPSTTRTPVEALRPGALPSPPDPSIDDQIAEAQKKGDVMAVIRLNGQKLATQTKN